jgi:ribosome-associated protein
MTKATDPRAPDQEAPSKSARKREAAAILELGERLATLSPAELGRVPLEPEVREAVLEARGIRSRQARRRQLRLVAKRLRASDAEAVRAALGRLNAAHTAAVRSLQEVARWRDRLTEGNEGVLGEFLSLHPAVDRQQLCQLVRVAQEELRLGYPHGARRKLFRYIRDRMTYPSSEHAMNGHKDPKDTKACRR